MHLNTLFNLIGAKKRRKRVGRGTSSGTGKTCGKGTKGQKSRSGVSIKTEGGQMPLIKRLPKRGFNCSKSINYKLLSIADIINFITASRIDATQKINKDVLVSIGYIDNTKIPVKLLGSGIKSIEHKLTVELDAYSTSSKFVIEKSGGNVI